MKTANMKELTIEEFKKARGNKTEPSNENKIFSQGIVFGMSLMMESLKDVDDLKDIKEDIKTMFFAYWVNIELERNSIIYSSYAEFLKKMELSNEN
ncbi:hypothetical protein HQ584_07550 [Patescibacteria group bacterium]|nr:hypothetical protein [Patescibacteria group bacterium]